MMNCFSINLCSCSLIKVFELEGSKIEEFSIGQIVVVLLILDHRVLTPSSPSSRRRKGRKSSYGTASELTQSALYMYINHYSEF